MSRGWAKASACCLQTTLSCAILCHIVSLQYLSRSSLHRLAGLPCRLFLSYGLQLVIREVHRSSLRRLICPAQDHFIFLTVLIISMTFVLSLTQMLVFLSLYTCDVEHTSFHFCLCGRKFVLCLFGQCPCLCTMFTLKTTSSTKNRGTSVPGNIGSGNIGTGEHRYRGT